jgi:Arc/MetJ-type ribon-helix-helix transcriptional regulator
MTEDNMDDLSYKVLSVRISRRYHDRLVQIARTLGKYTSESDTIRHMIDNWPLGGQGAWEASDSTSGAPKAERQPRTRSKSLTAVLSKHLTSPPPKGRGRC